MQADERKRRTASYGKVKVIFETLIGVGYFVAGVLLVFANKLGFNFTLDASFLRLFGGLLILYGLFRIYRGIKQLFLNREE